MRLDLIRIVKLSAYSFWPIASAFVLLGLTTLTSSKTPSWWIGMILGILGFLNKFDMVMIPLLPGFAFWFVAVGFMLLVISAVFRKI
jgi:hypothetical protein